MDDRGSDLNRHEVTLLNREQVFIKGVVHVDSFDDEEVVLDTELGTLTLRGEDLHMKELNLEQGSLSVEGTVNGIQYGGSGRGRGARGRGKGFLDRLLK